MDKQIIRKGNDGSIECEVAVMIIVDDDNTFTAFCPALQLSTYGDSAEDVKDAFNEALGAFIEEMEEKNVFQDELIRLGWTLEAGIRPHFRQPENISVPTYLLNKSNEVITTPFRIPA